MEDKNIIKIEVVVASDVMEDVVIASERPLDEKDFVQVHTDKTIERKNDDTGNV